MHELHCIRHMKLCPKCNEPVNKNAMQEHMETEHKEIKCPACGMKVYEKQLTQHQVSILLTPGRSGLLTK